MNLRDQISPEFSRLFSIERAFLEPVQEKLEADAFEKAALARRFDLPSLDHFSIDWTLSPLDAQKVKAVGLVRVSYTRTCVVSLEVFSVSDQFKITRYFWKDSAQDREYSESEDEDCESFEQGFLDLGEISSEELSLSLDPYPKKPQSQEESSLLASSVSEDLRENPFFCLKDYFSKKDGGAHG